MVRIGAFFFSAIAFLMSSSVFAGDKPNIIVMVADDLGWADVGFHGNQIIETPSLDRIAAEGTQLNRFYTTPICSA
jgi:arylsulfatase B